MNQIGRPSLVRVADLAAVLGAQPFEDAGWEPERPWTGGASIDSRSIRAGEIFFALRGERTDGHLFLAQAFARGAAAAVVERGTRGVWAGEATGSVMEVRDPAGALRNLASWYRGRIATKIVCVTGSMGKTTTKELCAAALASAFSTAATEGNRNNELGVPLSILSIRREHEVAVLELGASRRGDIELLAAIARPDIGVITGIAPAHLASFGSVDGVLDAKWELADAVASTPGGVLIVNGDDARLRERAASWKSRVVTYGFRPGTSLRATGVRAVETERTPPGARMEVEGFSVRLALLGKGALYAALAALAVSRELGAPLARAIDRLAGVAPMPGRLFVHSMGEVVLIDDAYNASPAAVANALEVLAAWPASGRRVAVLGDMLELGGESAAAHRTIGRRVAEAHVDLLFVSGEWAEEIAGGARDRGFPGASIHRAVTRDDLALSLSRTIAAGDVVLLKASRRGRFDEVARAILGGRTT